MSYVLSFNPKLCKFMVEEFTKFSNLLLTFFWKNLLLHKMPISWGKNVWGSIMLHYSKWVQLSSEVPFLSLLSLLENLLLYLKFFLTNFQNFFENDFSDNFLTTFLVIFLITFLHMFLMFSNYFYDTFSDNFYKKEPSEIIWTHQLSICDVDSSGPDESN